MPYPQSHRCAEPHTLQRPLHWKDSGIEALGAWECEHNDPDALAKAPPAIRVFPAQTSKIQGADKRYRNSFYVPLRKNNIFERPCSLLPPFDPSCSVQSALYSDFWDSLNLTVTLSTPTP